MLEYDLETDGLLDVVTVVHCLHIWDTERLEEGVQRYNDHGYKAAGTVAEGVKRLGLAEERVAHNGIGFDYLVLDKLYPGWDVSKGKRLDSIVMTRVIWTELKAIDFGCRESGYWRLLGKSNPVPEVMGGIVGSHSLAAWGARLGEMKDDYDPRNAFPLNEDGTKVTKSYAWKNVGWNEEMDDYCVQDVTVLHELMRLIATKKYSQQCLDLEHQFATIIDRQERWGFLLDQKKAMALHEKLLTRQVELNDELQPMFPPWYAPDGKGSKTAAAYIVNGELVTDIPVHVPPGYRCPKVKNGPRNETAGAPFTKLKHITFNPGSTDHIGQRLKKVFGWEPELHGKDGKPTCDDDVLSTLDYPCIPAIREYQVISKRLGMLADGTQAILKKLHKDGRIHGRVSTNGAGTGRCTHSQPNVAQTPKVGSPYGAEFRELYCVQDGWKLVGADASGLELRIMAHYMARFDGGVYADEVVNGDAHWVNLKAIGVANCDRDKHNSKHNDARNAGKTWVYAYLYGCGVPLSGINFVNAYKAMHGAPPKGKLNSLGSKSRNALKRNLPALGDLEKAVKAKAKREGRIKGLDGRYINIRSQHSALNALFQSAGAIVMKKALCYLDEQLQEAGFIPGEDYEFVANVHDEWQVEVRDVVACAHEDAMTIPEVVSAQSEIAMTRAGEFFNLKVRIDGEGDIGNNWKETH